MELINEWLRSHGLEVFVGSTAVAVGGMIWLLSVIIKGFWRTDAEKSIRDLAGFKKKVEAMIDQAVKCAPPVEAKESEEGVPFEVYRKDLLRMVEQEISLDEFVDIWRGRKVQKRLKPGDIEKAKEEAATQAAGLEGSPEAHIQLLMNSKFWRGVLKEWKLHIQANQDPKMFAHVYMEWMSDPSDLEGQRATTEFATFMQTRSWNQVMEVFSLDSETLAIFSTPAAAEFYEGFRKIVIANLRDYWEGFIQVEKAEKEKQVSDWDILKGWLGTPLGEEFVWMWERHIESMNPVGFADRIISALVNDVSSTKVVVAKFIEFIRHRSWDEVFELIKPRIEGPSEIRGAYAEIFFKGFRDHVNAWVMRHLDQFREAKNLQVGGPPGHPGVSGVQGAQGAPDPYVYGATGCQGMTGVGWNYDPRSRIAISNLMSSMRELLGERYREQYREYKVGQWVRVTRPSSPAVGLLGLIYKVNAGGDNIRIEVRNVRNDPNFLGLMRGDFEIALPKNGEWWKMEKCSNSTCKDDPFDKNQKFITEPFEMKVDVFSKDPHVVRAHCGCMTPVNFGRGERSS